METRERPDIPEEKIIEVNNNIKKIDFKKPYKFIYFERWFAIVTAPLFALTLIMVFFSSFYFGLRVKGKRNVNKVLRKNGCITVSNHCHYFDTVFANYILLPKRLYVSVVQRNYEVPFVRFVLRVLKAFPIPANPVGFKMITGPVGEALKRGYHIHFLPEGELVHLSQTIHKFKLGAFHQSYLHQAPVIPMVYILKRRHLFGKELPPNWVKMTCVFGEAHYPPALKEGHTFPKQELREMAEKVACWMEDTIAEYHKS
ncbi:MULTISPECIES: lysophospholipid acyltransferase family protein [unclassified Oceanispirochaeta]|uniref:lysophospholipid acyltransferase family protein n=1 Tax=unclassified Oceanispirochaeta TaxID=2635722 RepID=UPI000E090382|nr:MULTISPECIES: lysophospholipid acyltransferase family protein [unclassified Oceanispirochaeta]MBF9015405.1 1-acyl-sn-glycerol-3-phosphate acyltransferase [Oceanispirochaeta sp. M2]NPD71864.1 1-acyl-sn-glycerol-3-phosphate acyltransferase [Oceanispirochaeta sp. M1]RDG32673.1 1-acyl-sn-glycerol-3-phosphate acyltransferase [Oceanispirochaeta sp. M1]